MSALELELGHDPDEVGRHEIEARDIALAIVADHANETWLDFARYAVAQVALARPDFIVDAVWEAGLGKPPEARAIGAVMTWAKREGLIEPTNEFRPSNQAGCHRVPRRVWRSLAYAPSSS